MKSIPQHVHDRARQLAEVHPLSVVAELIGVLPSRMKKRKWMAPPDGRPIRRMPTDFAIQSRHMTHAELVQHYKAGNSTVIKWFAELEGRRPSWKGRHLRRQA